MTLILSHYIIFWNKRSFSKTKLTKVEKRLLQSFYFTVVSIFKIYGSIPNHFIYIKINNCMILLYGI